ncbi:MAG: PEP-CTERM sorting domain-containing protein [Pirellulales bacterium]|nr:PEP-CTERM sorting domain-containing protein [Pirellulales bacterium]
MKWCLWNIFTTALCLAAALVVFSTNQTSADYMQVVKLTSSDGVTGDAFGYGVAYDGSQALVSSRYNTHNSVKSGAAYLYEPDGSGGYDEYKLVPSDAGADDEVGSSVLLSGDYAYVGGRKHDLTVGETTYTDTGAVWVFQRQVVGEAVQWNQVAKIVASTPADSRLFGGSLSVDGGNMCIGGNKYAEFCQGSGSSWTSIQTVTSSSGSFGSACKIDGDTAVIAAHTGGAVYIYEYDSDAGQWASTTTLTGSGSARFGICSTLDGDNVAAGADRTTVSGLSRAGAAYVYNRNEGGEDAWGQVAMLTSDDPQVNGYFGHVPSIDGNRMVVGAYGEDHGADADTGAAYVYEYGSSWTQVGKIYGPVAGEQFGVDISLVGNTVLIGDYTGEAAYIYLVPEPSTFVLLGFGLLGLVALVSKSRRQ